MDQKNFKHGHFLRRNKFDCISKQVNGNIDILLALETKIDASFLIH